MAEGKGVVHMMGICGTAMASLAGLLQNMGYKVRGSDQNVYPPMSTKLSALGIPILEGYKPENLEPRPDKVIVGNVMTRNHSEVQHLLTTDIPYMSLPQALGEYVIRDRNSVVISGTHGKTTTTALCAWVLEQGELQPGFLVGGIPLNFPNSFSLGEGRHFVIEGDEYDTAFFDKVPKFIHYKPRHVILTSVEFDHADIYKDLDAVKDAFKMLLRLIPAAGSLVYNADDANITGILSEAKNGPFMEGYGVNKGEWRLGDIYWGEGASQFDVVYKGARVDTIQSGLFGEYNLLNALAVYAMARHLGISAEKIRQAMAGFKGVKRRQEIIGQPGGVTIIDDFAHHPTAVRVTIDGVRQRFSKSKIIAVFEPRSATSRRKFFQHDFAQALTRADQVIVSVPYDQSQIPEGERFDSKSLIDEIKAVKPTTTAVLGRSVDEIVELIKRESVPGNVVLLMSNGGFGGIYQKLLQQLS